MQVQKRKNIIINEIVPEKCLNCNQLISPMEQLNHKTTCPGILNKDQKNSDQKQEQLIHIDQKANPQLNQPNQQLEYPIQQQNQIQKKDVPTQVNKVKEAKNPHVQQKEPFFHQEQIKYQDDLKIYQNEFNNKHNLILQNQYEQNKQQNEQGQQIILQVALINKGQTQAQPLEKQQKQINIGEQDQQQLQNEDLNQNTNQQNKINIQQIRHPQMIALQQVNQKVINERYKQTKNRGHGAFNKNISEEKKRDHNQFKETNQFNQNFNQQQIQTNRNQEQKYYQHLNIVPYNQFYRQQQIFQQQQQYLPKQQQYFNQISPQNNILDKKNPLYLKSQQNLNQNNPIVQQQQQKKIPYQQNRQVQNKQQQIAQNNKIVRNRAISDFNDRKQFQFIPGMMITDQQVEQMTPEEIYEYFTQLDLDNQVGLKSKIIVLENKRVQINSTDNCAICLDEIQPQKEAVDVKLDCNHQFHYDCIKQWLMKSKYCPVCKEYVTYQNIK